MNSRTSGITQLSAVVVVIAIMVAGIAIGLTVLFGNNGNSVPPYLKGTSSITSISSSRSTSFQSTGTDSDSTTTSSSLIQSSLSSSSSISTTRSSTTSTSSSTSASTTTITGGSDYTIFKTSQPDRAGYEVAPNSGYSLLSLSASWIVPAASCNGVPSGQRQYSYMWVGIEDSGHTNDLEQTGTTTNCVGSSPSYFAWIDFYPSTMIIIDKTILPGDLIQAQVYYSLEPSTYTLTISDQSQGWTKTLTGSGGNNYQADWVVEDPAGYPLTNFGSVTFSSCTMTLGHNGIIIDSPIAYHDYIVEATLVSSDYTRPLASTSNITGDSTSFTITWQSSQ